MSEPPAKANRPRLQMDWTDDDWRGAVTAGEISPNDYRRQRNVNAATAGDMPAKAAKSMFPHGY